MRPLFIKNINSLQKKNKMAENSIIKFLYYVDPKLKQYQRELFEIQPG